MDDLIIIVIITTIAFVAIAVTFPVLHYLNIWTQLSDLTVYCVIIVIYAILVG